MNMRHMLAALAVTFPAFTSAGDYPDHASVESHAVRQVREGRDTFRFATFGDETFWGDGIGLHLALAGANNGGVGPGVSPTTALGVGLKVDVDALPRSLIRSLARGKVDLQDPATTLALSGASRSSSGAGPCTGTAVV
jgi:hypothetical protein